MELMMKRVCRLCGRCRGEGMGLNVGDVLRGELETKIEMERVKSKPLLGLFPNHHVQSRSRKL